MRLKIKYYSKVSFMKYLIMLEKNIFSCLNDIASLMYSKIVYFHLEKNNLYFCVLKTKPARASQYNASKKLQKTEVKVAI